MSFGCFPVTGSWTTSISPAKVLTRLHEAHQDGSKRSLVLLKKESKRRVADEKGRDRWIQAHGMDTLIWCLNAWRLWEVNIRRPGTRLWSLAGFLRAECGSPKKILEGKPLKFWKTWKKQEKPPQKSGSDQMWLSMHQHSGVSNEWTLFKMNYSGTFQEFGLVFQNVFHEHPTESRNIPKNITDQLKLWAEKISGIFSQYNPICFSNTP